MNSIGKVLSLSLVVFCVSAFPQDIPKPVNGPGKSGLDLEVEFMKARNDLGNAELKSKELLAAKIDLDTFQMGQGVLKTNGIYLLEANVRLAQAKLVQSGRLMSPELAKDKADLETVLLNLATKESIEKGERYRIAYDLALTEEVQRAKDRLTILENSIVTPEGAAEKVRAQKLLDQAVTPELRQARTRIEVWRKEARSKIPDADKADRHVKEVAARARSEELIQSIRRVDALMKQAGAK